jgi:hypothetical protein
MIGVYSVKHALNVDPKARPGKKPLRRFDEPKRKAIASKLHHLENVIFIKENQNINLDIQPSDRPNEKRQRTSRLCRLYSSQ